MVFRVDLRLRPEGRNGPLCNSLAAAERYYETFGRTWERQAWLRARPVRRRPRARRASCCAILEPFIYPRSIDPRMVDDVRGLRALFRDPADAAARWARPASTSSWARAGSATSRWSSRRCSCCTPASGRDLRERNTPRALPRLVVAGLLGDREARTLLAAYRFWRRARAPGPGRRRARSSHRLPGDDAARARFADGLGFADLAAFDAEVAAAARRGRGDRGDAGRSAAEMRLRGARLLDPMRDRAELERLAAAAGFRDTEAAADTPGAAARRACRPRCCEAAIASPDPDRALLALPRPDLARLGRR